jgi:hypothetical protein
MSGKRMQLLIRKEMNNWFYERYKRRITTDIRYKQWEQEYPMNYPDGMTKAHYDHIEGWDHDLRCPLHPDQPGYICREKVVNVNQPCGNILEEYDVGCNDCGINIDNSDGDWEPEKVVDDDCRCVELLEAAKEIGMGL